MFPHLRAAAFALLVATIPPLATAADRRPHPADPDNPVPATAYESAFAGYRKAAPADEKIDWRRANDAVREAGGHAGAVQDAAVAQPAPAHGPTHQDGMPHAMPMQHGMPMPHAMPPHHRGHDRRRQP